MFLGKPSNTPPSLPINHCLTCNSGKGAPIKPQLPHVWESGSGYPCYHRTSRKLDHAFGVAILEMKMQWILDLMHMPHFAPYRVAWSSCSSCSRALASHPWQDPLLETLSAGLCLSTCLQRGDCLLDTEHTDQTEWQASGGRLLGVPINVCARPLRAGLRLGLGKCGPL